VPHFLELVKIRLKDIYISQWREGVRNSSTLMLFKEIKDSFELSPYLLILDNQKHRHTLTKLRLISQIKFNIEKGRHRNISREDRKCLMCSRMT
jgi:hypothetical protein